LAVQFFGPWGAAKHAPASAASFTLILPARVFTPAPMLRASFYV